MAKIVSRWDADKVLFEADGDIRKTVAEAVAKKADLRGADLRGACLDGADLRGACLRGADLRGADLRGADLHGACLRGADLHGACLRGADLRGADLRGVKINWESHDMIAEILRRAAGEDVAKRKVAGLILISRDWCWDRFAAIDDPLAPWAMAELARWIQPDDDHPAVLDACVPLVGEEAGR